MQAARQRRAKAAESKRTWSNERGSAARIAVGAIYVVRGDWGVLAIPGATARGASTAAVWRLRPYGGGIPATPTRHGVGAAPVAHGRVAVLLRLTHADLPLRACQSFA